MALEDSIFIGGKGLEAFFILFFTVLAFAIVLRNPRGVTAWLNGLTQFTSKTTSAFLGGGTAIVV